jgi:uncharacterized membrane protein
VKKVNLRNAKIFGLIGTLLSFVGIILNIFIEKITLAKTQVIYKISVPLLSLVAAIFLLIAFYEISKKTEVKEIFNNYLTTVLIAVVGSVFIVVVAVTFPILIRDITHLPEMITSIALTLSFIAIIASSIFMSKAFRKTGEVLNNKYFTIASRLILYGAYTLIILVGIVLFIAGTVYEMLGFAHMPDEIVLTRR